MKLIIEKDYESMSKRAAQIVAAQITLKADSNLGLATGGTPLAMYEKLSEMYQEDKLDFSKVTTFNLDEYCGLSAENTQSYHYYMENNFFKKINIKAENTHIPDGAAEDLKKECRDYEKLIKNSEGIDLQILGIGSNAHIGFNEPAAELNAVTEVVDLTEETIKANSRYFEDEEEVPKKAVSMGIATILKADKIVLLASGKNKAEAIKKTINSKISTEVPSSLLQTHSDLTIVIDKEAASLLKIEKLSADCNLEISN